jgi:hypothetical protein
MFPSFGPRFGPVGTAPWPLGGAVSPPDPTDPVSTPEIEFASADGTLFASADGVVFAASGDA